MPSEPHTTLPEQIQDLSLRSEQQETVTMPAGETREAPVILDADEASTDSIQHQAETLRRCNSTLTEVAAASDRNETTVIDEGDECGNGEGQMEAETTPRPRRQRLRRR
ncbi:hypothetical protein V491_01161 [Pseudogymnoascus sp. VKM F-3775]|nr:hypothetical protein V491_01161 [Pseudogymnoascus sp. VKM F-3775]